MPYQPHTDADRAAMLQTIGVATVDDLFADIPPEVRATHLDLPDGEPEQVLLLAMEQLAAANRTDLVSFLGAGAYRHHIPAVVDEIIRRGEFLTAYTPYQPEVSQGTLQTIFEYESMVGELFDLDVVSASHYDGASATAEAALMMLRATKSRRVLISEGVHPHVRRVVATYFQDRFVLDEVPIADDGSTDLVALRRTLADAEPAGGLIMAQPNFFGILEPMAQAADVVHEAGGLFTAVAEPVSLALLAPPGEVGADIAAADGQPLGIPLQYGGPSVGLLACTRTLARQIPGRLIGRAKDADGRSCYVMTLRAREQDIRRERAASNICTNQALCALATTVYLATLGPAGLRSVAEQGAARAHDLEDSLREIGIHRVHAGPYLNEFAVWVPNARRVHEEMLDRGYLAGLPLSDCFPERRDELLLCATELTTLEEIEGFTRTLATVVGA